MQYVYDRTHIRTITYMCICVYDRTHTYIYIYIRPSSHDNGLNPSDFIPGVEHTICYVGQNPMCFHVFFMCYVDSIEKTWKHIGVLLIVMCFLCMFILNYVDSVPVDWFHECVLFVSYAPKSALHVLFIAYPSSPIQLVVTISSNGGSPNGSRSQVDEVWTNRENRWCVELSPWKPHTKFLWFNPTCLLAKHQFIRFKCICSTCLVKQIASVHCL